jgi:hypothetical protein
MHQQTQSPPQVTFSVTTLGLAALGSADNSNRVPRRRRDVCACGHRGHVHNSRRACTFVAKTGERCACRALNPVGTWAAFDVPPAPLEVAIAELHQ